MAGSPEQGKAWHLLENILQNRPLHLLHNNKPDSGIGGGWGWASSATRSMFAAMNTIQYLNPAIVWKMVKKGLDTVDWGTGIKPLHYISYSGLVVFTMA